MRSNLRSVTDDLRSLFISLLIVLSLHSFLGAEKRALWWWGTGIIPEKFNKMMALSVDDVFIKAGRIFRQNGIYKFKSIVIPDKYRIEQNRTSLHIVIPYLFKKDDDIQGLVKAVAGLIKESRDKLKKHGFSVTGIQFDVEGDIKVEEYIFLMDRLKSDLGRYLISGCFYPSYFKKKDIRPLMDRFDFLCIMFYDYSYDFKDYRMTDAQWINSQLSVLSEYKVPFYIGLPLYGVISVFDRKGRLKYPQIDLPDMSIFNTKRFKLVGQIGPILKKYQLRKKFKYKYLDFQKGWYFYIFDPDKEYIKNILDKVDKDKDNIMGFSFFPYPMTGKWKLKHNDLQEIMKK
ncbi:MAG: glycoside hydrolase family 18 protein [Spirochaetes bacterium]|nr:glycoside hydrolase family 18 protein [Spirochaetota bacterium]